STSGTFSVNTPALITSQSNNIAPCLGGTAVMEVVVSGTNLSFQWQRDGVNLPGATSPRLTLTFVNLGSTGMYQCVVNGAAGCAGTISKPILLSITPNIEFTTQPANIVTGVGRTIVMSVETNTPTGVTFQWFRRNTAIVDDSRITGSRTANLTIRNIQAIDFGHEYNCVATSTCGTVKSNMASLLSGTVLISSPQQNTSIVRCAGETAEFAIQATTTTGGGLTYIWRKNNVNLTNDPRYANSQLTERLSISALTIADTGRYSCVVTSSSSGAQATSASFTLNIEARPSVTTQPTNKIGCPGETIQFTLGTATTGTYTYNWQLNGSPVTQTTIPTLTLSTISTAQAGDYRCIVTNTCGSDTTNQATLTIGEKTVITVQPRATVRLLEGGTIVLSVEATGSNLRYQWFKGSEIISGTAGQSPTLTISNALFRDRGEYTCRVTGDCGIENTTRSVVDIITSVE
ncbi:MAG: immunoglobulin domain-containing protein, partial [Candidatus Kapabacteria bacterium]|nr:immunoglobulin domain-containing protein [Candidatus Kapabacteria bacterium]